MPIMQFSSLKATREVISSILNWVCPECGGRMGGRGQEFKCQGECRIDWRQIWENALAAGRSTKVPAMQRL
jgi:tRNA(Ile2) C34 agmatinyltransferase TiaS